MLTSLSTYKKLTGDDQPEGERLDEGSGELEPLELDCARRPSEYSTIRIVALVWKSFIVALALYGLADLVQRAHDAFTSKKDNSCYCGRSVAEATAMGCQYDLLASAWLPDWCRDKELSAEFDQAGPGPGGAWDYFADSNGTIPIVPSEVGLIADTNKFYHTTNEWHIVHCVYYWRKQYRSRLIGTVVEARYDNEGHIKHCGKTFL
ncbi:hypothetical protein A1F97_10954, partial [Pyrenophora tritici-repentis]